MVTVDSICIQAYLVFKAGGGKKKEKEEKNPNFHRLFSKYSLIMRHNSLSCVNKPKMLGVEHSKTH